MPNDDELVPNNDELVPNDDELVPNDDEMYLNLGTVWDLSSAWFFFNKKDQIIISKQISCLPKTVNVCLLLQYFKTDSNYDELTKWKFVSLFDIFFLCIYYTL